MSRTVVAALDNSLAANPVLVAARALARALGARVEAIHVLVETEQTPHHAAVSAGVPLRVVSGPVVNRLVEAAEAEETAALVIGARSKPASPHPLGSTALAVVTSASKPIVVVPPVGRIAPHLRRVLVPLEGSLSTSLAPRSLIELGERGSVEVIALHIVEDRAEPEEREFDEEFLRRYCPSGIGVVKLERRMGPRDELVALAAEELDCDLIALGWAQQLARGRAPVVRKTLERSPLPVMLIPVRLETGGSEVLAASAGGST